MAASSSIQLAASGCWIAWFCPIGRSNTTRSLGVSRGALRSAARPSPTASARDQDALGVHAVQDVFEAPALLADAVGDRHRQLVDEQLVRVDGLAAHLLDLAHLDAAAVEIGVEQAQAFGRRFTSSSGVVRASSSILSATCAVEIQIFWPSTT